MILLGPSGVGKSTLVKEIESRYPKSFGFSVSYTTRDRRPDEIDGVDYNFVTKWQF